MGSSSEEEFAKLIPSVSEQGIFTVSASGEVTAWEHKSFPFIFFNQKHWQVTFK